MGRLDTLIGGGWSVVVGLGPTILKRGRGGFSERVTLEALFEGL